MPFEPIAAPNLAAAASSQLRSLIASDVLRPGDQLPGERELAVRLGISRTSLREAVQTLVSEGLLVSKHGSGLRVSAEIGAALVNPLITLIESEPDAIFDYLDFRAMFEGEAAAIVAEKATLSEKHEIDRIVQQMRAAHVSGAGEAEVALDAEFHMAIVEATGNVISIQIARSLQELLRRGVAHHHALIYDNADARAKLLAQHEAVNAAILENKPTKARKAMQAHLAFVASSMRSKADEKRRMATVQKRQAWAEKGD